MDLLRIALGYHRGSIKMAQKFSEEARKRIAEVDIKTVKPNFAQILSNIENVLQETDTDKIAEDTLMYSTLCRNYAKHFA